MKLEIIEKAIKSSIAESLKRSECYEQDRHELKEAAEIALDFIHDHENHKYAVVVADFHYGRVVVAVDENGDMEHMSYYKPLSIKKFCTIRVIFEDLINPIRNADRSSYNHVYTDMVKFCEENGFNKDYVDELFSLCDNIIDIKYWYNEKVKAVVGYVETFDLPESYSGEIEKFSFAIPRIRDGRMIFVLSEYLDLENLELTDVMCAKFLSPFFYRWEDLWAHAYLYKEYCENKINEEDLISEILMSKLGDVI